MEPKKTVVCMCDNCGNEGEMTIKCEEVILEPPATPAAQPVKKLKRELVCSLCGNEAEMIVETE